MSSIINPFVDLPADSARQLHSDLMDALDRLAELPHHTAEVSALTRCLEFAFVEAVETPTLA